MSILTRMSIQGVRSFGTDPGDEQLVKFDSPLTLILGENGCGKTTIIECVKYALTGELPPGADKGVNFGHNPKINRSPTTQGQVKMKLIDPITERALVVTRTFRLTQEQKKMSFKSIDSILLWEDKSGGTGTLSGRCVDVNTEMISAMGVSKPILCDVLFCHQEDSYWPLDEGKKLKEKFDAIFDATKYNKCMDMMLKLRKTKEGLCKDAEKDVTFYKYKKDESASKRAVLKETEIKFHDCTEKIIKFKENLIPIEERLKQINEVENNIVKLKTAHNSIEIRLTNCKQQQDELHSKIKEIYQGDTENLQDKIESFHRVLSNKERNLETSKTCYTKAEDKEKEYLRKITTSETRKGELISMRGQEQELVASRNHKMNTMVQELDIETEDLDDSTDDISEALDLVKCKMTRVQQEFDQLSIAFDREDEKHQEKLNKLRENQATLKNDIKSKTMQMDTLDQDADAMRKQLDEIDRSASKLKDLANKIEVANKEQQKLSGQCDAEDIKKYISKKIEERKTLEMNLDRIDKELHKLQQQSGIRAELDVQKQLLNDKNNEARKIKNKYSDSLYTLFGDSVPASNFKIAVQKSYDDFNTEVRNLTKLINNKERECVAFKSNREHQKEKLTSIMNELNQYEEQVFEQCQGQEFESELAKLQENIQKNLKHRGTLSSSSFIYERYIETFQRADPCCPLCHRNFDTQEEVGELASELKMKLRKLPAEIEKAEIILKKDQSKYDTLLSLKPINEKIALIKEELPGLKDKLKKTEQTLQNAISEVESLKLSVCEPQSNMELANSLIPDMSMLDQNLATIQRLQKEVDNLQSKLPNEQVEWTLQDAQSEQMVIKAELQQTRDDIEHMQSKLSTHTEQMHNIREKKNKLVEEQLRLQSGVQARSQLSATYEKLQSQVAVLSVNIEECRNNLGPLQKQYDAALALKNAALEKNRASLREKRSNISKLEKQFDDIQKDTERLRKLNAQNLAGQVEEILSTLKKLYEARDEQISSRKKIQQEITQLQDDITNHQIQERDLTDNLMLRQKQTEELELQTDLKVLQKKMGNMDSNNILIEKSTLHEKHTNLCKGISEAKGKSMTLEENIKALKEELQTKYKDIDKQYLEKVYKLEVDKLMVKNLANYSLAMEWALMKYHEEKMDKINVLIKKMWREIYKGNDIDYITIRTDEASGVTSKRRTYNYRVVQIKNDIEIDMRGRCSAGQKVLACLIIRMALAEIFSLNCGVIALDEPTTNLDQANIESLALALAQLVESRCAQRNFMLIVISHDEEFIEALSRNQDLTKYHKVTRNKDGKSVITRIQIDNS